MVEMTEDIRGLVAEAQDHLDHSRWEFARTILLDVFAKGHRPAFIAQQLGDLHGALGDHQAGIAWHRRAIALEPRLYRSYENMIFMVDAQGDTTPAEARAVRRLWWDQFGVPAYAMRQPYRNTRDPHRRLRVGYVSGDFNFHSAAIAWTPVVTQHSDQIEAILYSTLEPRRYDNRTTFWQNDFGDHFVDVSAMSAHQLALTIQQDGVDILVDLSGYTNNNRLLTFAYAPAPIRIQAWGYVQGTASPLLTHIFADRVVAPPSVCADLEERVVYLPSVLTYHPPSKASGERADLPEATPLPCLTRPPVFSVFQRAMKVSDASVAVWRQLLDRLPTARISFKGADYTPVARTRIAEGFGPHRNRITFDTNTWHHDHLLWYEDVDLALDPWPHTGGVSTLEAMFMHVPTITLIGPRLIQRTSASFLTTVGLPDLIATTEAEYLDLAVAAVTTGRAQLAAIRQTLRARLLASPIIVGYGEAVMAAYRALWIDWCDTRKEDAA